MSSWKHHTIVEPFRIKSVESIPFLTRAERDAALREAHYNLFGLKANQVTIDLLTDSGTGAMSSKQWAAIMQGDESYAGSRSFFKFKSIFEEITGFDNVLPTHQGRAAERILMSTLLGPGRLAINNTHFDTTRANVEAVGGTAIDLPVEAATRADLDHPFKGNMDIEILDSAIKDYGSSIGLVMLTLTNNAVGGQPVSMANIKAVSERSRAAGIPFFLDAARFAENSWFIKIREPGWGDCSIKEITRTMFDYADGFTFSAKKDALVNIGGVLATRMPELVEPFRNNLILTEGFPSYGGLAGRDLEAIAVGVMEALDPDYLRYRIRTVQYLASGLEQAGVPIVQPVGGHAVYINAEVWAPQIPAHQFPAQAVANEIYLQGGIRGVEVGRLMFPNADLQLVRLAIPRRVYTQSHIDYVIEVLGAMTPGIAGLGGLRITSAPSSLRHFSAKLEPIEN